MLLSGACVTQELDATAARRGRPLMMVSDNVPYSEGGQSATQKVFVREHPLARSLLFTSIQAEDSSDYQQGRGSHALVALLEGVLPTGTGFSTRGWQLPLVSITACATHAILTAIAVDALCAAGRYRAGRGLCRMKLGITSLYSPLTIAYVVPVPGTGYGRPLGQSRRWCSAACRECQTNRAVPTAARDRAP